MHGALDAYMNQVFSCQNFLKLNKPYDRPLQTFRRENGQDISPRHCKKMRGYAWLVSLNTCYTFRRNIVIAAYWFREDYIYVGRIETLVLLQQMPPMPGIVEVQSTPTSSCKIPHFTTPN